MRTGSVFILVIAAYRWAAIVIADIYDSSVLTYVWYSRAS